MTGIQLDTETAECHMRTDILGREKKEKKGKLFKTRKNSNTFCAINLSDLDDYFRWPMKSFVFLQISVEFRRVIL